MGRFQRSKPAPGEFVVKYAQYSPHLIEKMASKPLSLATTSILGQPPGFQHVNLAAFRRLFPTENIPVLTLTAFGIIDAERR